MDDPLTIDVWSDIACPWCYIGKRRLEAGLAAYAGLPDALPVVVGYHSFQLAPDTPDDHDGSEVDFLVRHKGMSRERVEGMIAHVAEVARSVGLEYDFDALRHANTLAAHRLLHHAAERGAQAAVKEGLMRAYFVEGRHVGDMETLADLAAEAGLDRDEALRALREGEHLEAVEADQRLAREHGITGVPFFVIDGRYGVSGAQAPETFTAALSRAAADRAEAVA